MQPIRIALFIATTVVACAGTRPPPSGSEPAVPKKAIEKAADTRIADAGAGQREGDSGAVH